MKNEFDFILIPGVCHAIPLIIPIGFCRVTFFELYAFIILTSTLLLLILSFVVRLLGISSTTYLWIFEGANP